MPYHRLTCLANGSTPSERSFVALDIPSDSHMLPGRGKRVECHVPVICAADEDEIQDLVISTVCQHHVWGISLPVVGFSLPKTGTIASIVMGWASIENDDSVMPSLRTLFLRVLIIIDGLQFILHLHKTAQRFIPRSVDSIF